MPTPVVSHLRLLIVLALSVACMLQAQTTITYTDTQTDVTARTATVADPLTFTIADGFATQSGVIDGDGSVTKTGSGTISLAGANTYSGGTVVDAGILAIDHDGEFTFGTLGSGTTTINGDTGSGSSGTLQFLTNSSAGSGAFTLTGGATSGGSGGGVEFYGTSTAGSGTFTAEGATAGGTFGGYVMFLGTSTAGSATLIANGSANAGAGGSILFVEDSLGGTATVKVYGNGSLDIGYHNAGLTIGSLEGSGQAFLGANNLTVGSNNSSTTFSGTVQDGSAAGGVLGSLTKIGTGTLTLSGANTYTGSTTITAGQITMGDAGALGTGSVSVASGATLDASSYGFDLNRLGGAGTITSSGAYTASPASDVSLETNLTGTASLTKDGSATLTLTGTNTYTGGTTISVGTLQIGNGGTTGSIVGDVVDNTSLTFNRSDALTYAGVISGSGSVTQAGTGTLTLTGTNTYAGGTTVRPATAYTYGMLEFSSGDNLGTGNITLDGGGLKWAAGNTTDISSRLNPLTENGSIFDTNGNDITFASSVSGASYYNILLKTGAGTLTLAAGSTVVDFEVIGGTLVFGTGTYQDRYLYVGNGGWATSVNGAASSAAILSGAGTSFGSQETSVGSYTAFSASLTISDGASFATTSATIGDHSTAESTVTVTGAGSTFTGDVSLGVGNTSSGRSSFLVSDDASATFQSTVVIGNRSTGESLLTVSGTGSTFTAAGYLTIGLGAYPGSAPFVTGASSMIVSGGASASAIGTQIGRYGATGANSLTLTGIGSTFTTGSLTLALSALDNGTVNLGSAASDAATAAGILDTGTVTGGLGAAVLQFNTTGTDLAPTYFTRDGTSTGPGVNTTGGLSIVNTAGTTVLSGTLAHTGATRVNGGTLRVNGSLTSSAVTVASGATFGGSGTIGGLSTFESGAHLAPGNSPGTLTFTAGLTLNDGALLDLQLGTTSDLVVASGGTLSSDGTVTVNLSDSGGFTAGTYDFIDASGATLTGIDATSFELGTTIAGYDFTFTQSGNLFQLVAVTAAIPEPATCATLLGAAGLGLALVRRRQTRS